jgi:intraflagellar transport protein 81
VLKHKASIDDPVKYHEAIQNGQAEVILPVMAWILERKDALKTRAYLANFLVEIEIPFECLSDDEISETRQKYLTLIEEFKTVHKQYEKLKLGQQTCGLVTDMQNCEHDLECIRRRIEMARSKYTGYPDLQNVLKQASLNRKARDKAHELCKQAHIEELKLRETEEKIRINRRLLKDLRDKNGGRTAEGVVEALEENCEVLKYIVLEKIPSEMDSNERCITAMKLVDNDPPNSQQDIADLRIKTQMMKNELHAFENRLLRKLHDGDLQQLREQVEQLEKVRGLKSSKLSCIHRELFMQRKVLEHQSLERSSKSKGVEELSDEQYFNFMKKMRVKVSQYKQMRAELARLQNEAGILAGTKFILGGELKETEENLTKIEAKLGISGFSKAQEKLESLSSEKAALDETNRTNLHEMSCMSKDLHDKIALKKLYLEPLIKELQSKRLSTQLLEADFTKVKDQYQSCLTAVELDTCHYKTKLDQLLKEEMKLNLEFSRLTTEISIIQTNIQRASEESQLEGLYIGKEKSRGFKDKLLTKILEEERRSKALKEEQDTIEQVCAQRRSRAELWGQLTKLLKAKISVLLDE